MAKLDLAIVLKTIDKASAPLKEVKASFGTTNKIITAAQQKLKNTTALQGQINQFRELAKNTGLTGDKYKVASSKLEKLQAKVKQTKAPSAALLDQLKKQQTSVNALKGEHSEYIKRLDKLRTSLKKSSIDTTRLSAAEKMLGKQQRDQISQISKLQRRYAALATVKKRLAGIKISSVLGGAKNMALGGGVIGAGIFAFARVVNKNAASLDKLAKASKNLDFPIDKLQSLQHHATLSGVSTDTTTTSLIRFNKRLGVLKTTGAGALGSFLKMGKNQALYNQFKATKDTAAAYEILLKSFGKMKDEHKRMALLDAAFGGSGRSMMVMMREGMEGLSAAKKEFNELGGGANQEDVQAAENYNDAWHKLMTGINNIKIKVLTPIMQKLTASFSEFTDKLKNADFRDDAIKQVRNTILKLATGLKFIYNSLSALVNYFPEIIAGFVGLKIAVFAVNAAMISNPIGLWIAGIAALATGLVYLYTQFAPVRDAIYRITAAIKTLGLTLVRVVITPFRLLLGLLAKIPSIDLFKDMDAGLAKFDSQLKKSSIASMQNVMNGKIDHSTVNNSKSQSELTVTINSKEPVTIDKAQTDKDTDMTVNTGYMGLGFSF